MQGRVSDWAQSGKGMRCCVFLCACVCVRVCVCIHFSNEEEHVICYRSLSPGHYTPTVFILTDPCVPRSAAALGAAILNHHDDE